MRSIVVNTVLTRVPTFGSHVRSRLHFASAAVNGSPLCHLTPGPTLNVHCVCPWSLHPGLATEGKLHGQTQWTFRVRPGVKWHNGDPVTAADAEWSLERTCDPQDGT